jgi:hypothetical protein
MSPIHPTPAVLPTGDCNIFLILVNRFENVFHLAHLEAKSVGAEFHHSHQRKESLKFA